jgi:Holliday junction resolvasome RuvABC endonuclease subunit
MIIFAHDPGTRNYGYSIVEGEAVDKTRIRFRVLENGLCPHTIITLKDHKQRRREKNDYMEWVAEKIEEYQPYAMIAERYMTRGISGPTIESVNMMLGILQSFNKRDKYIPAATWKNAVTRSGIELREWYKFCRVAPHPLDATLIGIYDLNQRAGIKDFGALTEKTFERLVYMVEDTTTSKLFNRKTRE